MRARLFPGLVFFTLVASTAACGGNSDSGPAPSNDASTDTAASADTGALEDAIPTEVADTSSDDTGTIADSGVDTSTPDAFATASHLPFPQIGKGDGVVLSDTKIVGIVTSGDPLATQLQQFGDAVPKSGWWQSMSGLYGLGDATHVFVTGPAMSAGNITVSQMTAYVTSLISAGQAPAADGHTVYMLYLPDGVVVNVGGKLNTNCTIEGGAHYPFAKPNADNIGYAQRCSGNTPAGLDEVTFVASHEIAESATDPTLTSWGLAAPSKTPWTSDVWRTMDFGYQSEVGDLCGGAIEVEGGFQYQRIWSNPAAAAGGDPCAPASSAPYYSIGTANGWTSIAAGASADIPVTGWSTAPVDDWYASVVAYSGPASTEFTIKFTTPRTHGLLKAPILNNGETGTLHVDVPATAKSGDWVVYAAYSQPFTTTRTSDSYHLAAIGVYVP